MIGSRLANWKTALVLVACGAWCGECAAQGTGLFGSRGPTGGQAGFGGTSAFRSGGGFGTTGFGGAGTGGFGMGGMGGSGGMRGGQMGMGGGFGQTGSMLGLGQNTFGQASGLGQMRPAGSMVGVGMPGQFVGSGATMGMMGQPMQQLGNMRMQRGNMTGPNQAQPQANEQSPIRPRLRIAFGDTSPPPPAAVNQAVQARLDRIGARRPDMGDVSLSLDGTGTARLQGTVASEDARRLAETLIGLEPGVRQVRNELVIVR